MKIVFFIPLIQIIIKIKCSLEASENDESRLLRNFGDLLDDDFKKHFNKAYVEFVEDAGQFKNLRDKLLLMDDRSFEEFTTCIDTEKNKVYQVLCCLEKLKVTDLNSYVKFWDGFSSSRGYFRGFKDFIGEARIHYSYLADEFKKILNKNVDEYYKSKILAEDRKKFEGLKVCMEANNYFVYLNKGDPILNIHFEKYMNEVFINYSEIFGDSLSKVVGKQLVDEIIEVKKLFLDLLYEFRPRTDLIDQ
ncbi:hypothetical protein EDEG_00630 [Edhazardia aedis USNM 41457]|uniref:Uncharacterized protein n=1 Tax=Edhazardia aedis (strain USNM 41457) TaxID=1003232 RepID=J9DVL0_EDHAE|nr:hypothetical protein EDEG_00630 [Edhazardia aedis USNM 41457]|eukprot:EJW05327.1 hypothetical protein EDEG_00630 [Edhazardia aedis USNM 41457]